MQCAIDSDKLDLCAITNDWLRHQAVHETIISTPLENYAEMLLNNHTTFAEELHYDNNEEPHFQVRKNDINPKTLDVRDPYRDLECKLPVTYLEKEDFDICVWYEAQIASYELNRLEEMEASKPDEIEV
ncbi:hypothetical protein CVT25_001197 [Psilocybe cyanescens]|uniref:Uncharacterized protein n=1 Tax=Psilocybe cyanescens TaxID=93625 RepID=A0A409XAX0_PSICY|nr:hypothetical protein CVT25_001197 [Psilocybe cyanescens]